MTMLQYTCGRCHTELFMKKNMARETVRCPHCSGTMYSRLGSDTVRIAEINADTRRMGMEFSYQRHRDNLGLARTMLFVRIIAAVLAVAVVAGVISVAVVSDREKVKLPFSSKDLERKTAQEAGTMLGDAGFTNIEQIPKADLWDGFLHNDQGNRGKVALITIDGDERFSENDRYHKDATVRIWYHTYP